jgi:MscS family membrane protein
MTREAAREAKAMASNLLQRAVATLDLSQVPMALRRNVGVETALKLKEILDRMLLPPLDAVPNAAMVAAARKQDAGPVRWRYPNTEIEIVEITEGERQGQFLFGADSVSRIPGFYEEVWELHYRRDFGTVALQYRSPDTSEGAFNAYISTPGYLIPHAHVLGSLVDALPDGLKSVQNGQTVWQWIVLVLSALALALASFGVFRLTRRWSEGLRSPLDEWLMIAAPILIALIVRAVTDFIDTDLNITGGLLNAVTASGQGIAMSAWVVLRLFKAIADTIIASPRTRIKEDSIDATMWRIGARIFGFLIGAWILIEGMRGLGANVVPLLAGLGVGGLAVALAAQNTLLDVFGSLIILADRPYRIGHWVIIGDQEGTVESIGILLRQGAGLVRRTGGTATGVHRGDSSCRIPRCGICVPDPDLGDRNVSRSTGSRTAASGDRRGAARNHRAIREHSGNRTTPRSRDLRAIT